MIALFLFLVLFFIALGAAYVSIFILFIPALQQQGFPLDVSLEGKTDYFLLFQEDNQSLNSKLSGDGT